MPEKDHTDSSESEPEIEEGQSGVEMNEESDAAAQDDDSGDENENHDSNDSDDDNDETQTGGEEEEEKVIHRNIYVQFPRKRPENAETELRKVSDKIKYIKFPRQNKARFCHIHCDTEEDAIEVENLLKSTEVCGMKLFVNRKRKIDDPEYRQKLKSKQIEKKIAKRDAKRLKKQLKQKSVKKVSKVNKIVVSNIPESAGIGELREIFKGSVDFQYREKPNKIAFVTFSTAEEATKFIKKKPKIEERELAVRPMLIVNRKKKHQRRRQNKAVNKEAGTEKGSVKIQGKKSDNEPKTKGIPIKRKEMKAKTPNKFMRKGNPGAKINYVSLKKTLE